MVTLLTHRISPGTQSNVESPSLLTVTTSKQTDSMTGEEKNLDFLKIQSQNRVGEVHGDFPEPPTPKKGPK